MTYLDKSSRDAAGRGLASVLQPVPAHPDEGHRIEPIMDSWYSVGPYNGNNKANLRNQLHYPVEALCRTCKRRIVAAQFLACDWVHEDRPDPR